MVMDGGSMGTQPPQAAAPAGDTATTPDANRVAREFVRQYYTILHESPLHLHRFYNEDSDFIHGGIGPKDSAKAVRGQQDIHRTIMTLNFRDCYAKISQVDAQESVNKSVVVQVAGELSNQGQPMRRFLQTFVLVPLSARKYYVRNDIFRYQDEIFEDGSEADDEGDRQPTDCSQMNGGVGGDEEDVLEHETILNAEHDQNGGVDDAKEVATPEESEWEQPAATPQVSQQSPPAPNNNVPQPSNPPAETHPSEAESSSVQTTPTALTWSQRVTNKVESTPSTQVQATAGQATTFGPPPTSHFGGVASPPNSLPQRPQRRPPPQQQTNKTSKHEEFGGTDNRPNEREREFIPDNLQLFVGNIPQLATDTMLIQFFSQFGQVQEFRLSLTKQQNGGGQKGLQNFPNFGFVVFENTDSVQKVLAQKPILWDMDGKGEVRLNVEEKKPRSTRDLGNKPRGGGQRNMGGGRPPMANGRGSYGNRGGQNRSGPPPMRHSNTQQQQH